MPSHPHADEARRVFEAFWVHGDVQPMLDAATDDFVWINDIGAGPWRELRGKDEAMAMQLWWFDWFEGTFRHELLDVCASDDRVVEVLHEVGEKDGHVFDNVALYVYEVGPDGRHTSLRTFDRDRRAIEDFWSHFPEVLAMDTGAVLAGSTAPVAPG